MEVFATRSNPTDHRALSLISPNPILGVAFEKILYFILPKIPAISAHR